MEAESLVLNLLNALPRKEVRGKKRLQKLSYLANEIGGLGGINFFLHDFGPFSAEIANAASFLSLVGEIEEVDAQIGPAKKFVKVYRLPDPSWLTGNLPGGVAHAVQTLDNYTTVELEVASTIRYFLTLGSDVDSAVAKTRSLKPSKSTPRVIGRALEALSAVGLNERRGENTLPRSRSD